MSWARLVRSAGILSATAALCSFPLNAGEEKTREEIVARVRHDIEYLSSDALEGRGLETKGIELAAEHIIAEYTKFGLKPGMPDGSWRQPFEVTMGDVVIGESTHVTLNGPNGTELKLAIRDQFQPVRRGANGEASGEVVFLGYGISSEAEKYDDYAGIDVKGKIVVIIRREPQNRPDGAFEGQQTSSNAYIDRKLELVQKSGAAAVIFVNDHASVAASDRDDLSDPSAFGNEGQSVPFVHVKQSVIDQLLAAAPLKAEGDTTLSTFAAVSEYIDKNLKPVSQPLAGWTADISTKFEANTVTAYNIIGVVEGEGPLADETIVIGGHYDHLGLGGFGSRAQNRTGEVHNGADDNASGTAAVMELARRFASGPKPKRRLVFICFSAEERGLLGSFHYVRSPVFPIENTVCMLNFDMIGNLKGNLVEVNGVGTAAEFRDIALKADEIVPVDITIIDGAFAGSDHLPFYQQGIPVMFCFTGMTDIYHTPDDDFSTLNIEGAVTVIDYSEQLLKGMDGLEKRPTFADSQPTRRRNTTRTPYLGMQPDLGASGANGVVVRTVAPDSPAATAGIQTGDVVIKVGDNQVEGYQTLIEKLVTAKPGEKFPLTIKRGAEELVVEPVLGEPRGRR